MMDEVYAEGGPYIAGILRGVQYKGMVYLLLEVR